MIATCNYEARAFGIPRCPVRGPCGYARNWFCCPDFERYRAASRQILDIYRDYDAGRTLVARRSLPRRHGHRALSRSATLMAAEIRARIHAEVGITVSAGIAPNKFIAKVASDWNKPDGQFVVRPSRSTRSSQPCRSASCSAWGGSPQRTHEVPLNRDLCRPQKLVAGRAHPSFRELRGAVASTVQGNRRASGGARSAPKIPVGRNDLRERSAGCCGVPRALDPLIDDLVARLGRLREGADRQAVRQDPVRSISRTSAECVSAAPGYGDMAVPACHGGGSQRFAVRLLGVGVRFAEPEQSSDGLQVSLFPEAPEDPHVVDVERRKSRIAVGLLGGLASVRACLQSASKVRSARLRHDHRNRGAGDLDPVTDELAADTAATKRALESVQSALAEPLGRTAPAHSAPSRSPDLPNAFRGRKAAHEITAVALCGRDNAPLGKPRQRSHVRPKAANGRFAVENGR